MCCHHNHCGVLITNATGEYHMKSYNTSIKVSLRHLMYWGILGKGVAATPNLSKGLIHNSYVQYLTEQLFVHRIQKVKFSDGLFNDCHQFNFNDVQ